MKTLSSDKRIRRAALDASFTCAALLLSFVEALFPLALLPLPGFKAGLANIAILFTAFSLSVPDAAAVSLCRILLTFLFFGSPTSLLFSFSGGALVIVLLALLNILGLQAKMSFTGISVLAAAAHNAGQLTAALFLTSTAVLSYAPALLAASLVYGGLTGILLSLLPDRLYTVPSHLIQQNGGKT
ncbi:MAG: Gx transporter family protein [Clostridia bacterium]|nr:Gx transporter family protein [Clostridia bacterium]